MANFQTPTTTLDRFALPILGFLVATIGLVAWDHPVTSMPMNRNDASCYLLLAHNMVEHGVYSLDQEAPFRPHTEWPPGIPLLYTIPMAVIGGFPLGESTWLIRLFVWFIASCSLWAIFRYLRLFCESWIAGLVTLCTLCSRAFLDESQAAFADIPAMGAMFLILYEIEQHFRSTSPSRIRSAIMLIGMSLLPLVKPYLGMVFVAYLWHIGLRWWRTDKESNRHFELATGIAVTGLCCLPFVGFIAYSMVAAEATGTISAVTWLVTDNPVEVREGVGATDPKTVSEWVGETIGTLKYHLVYHVTVSAFPILDYFDFRDWPMIPRLAVIGISALGICLGAARLLLRPHGATVATTFAMLVVFALLKCDSARYFIILTPLFACLFFVGVQVAMEAVEILRKWWSDRPRENQILHTTAVLLAVLAAVIWSKERSELRYDSDPLYDETYAILHGLQGRTDIETIVVPFGLRELTVVETGKRVITFAEIPSGLTAQDGDVAVLRFSDTVLKRRPHFQEPEILQRHGQHSSEGRFEGLVQALILKKSNEVVATVDL